MTWDDGTTLEEYVLSLLRRGLRRQDEEFKLLIRIYGEPKIVGMATKLLADEKNRKEREAPARLPYID